MRFCAALISNCFLTGVSVKILVSARSRETEVLDFFLDPAFGKGRICSGVITLLVVGMHSEPVDAQFTSSELTGSATTRTGSGSGSAAFCVADALLELVGAGMIALTEYVV